MPQKVQRVPYVPSASRKRTYECSLSLPQGDWVVWWYSSLKRNGQDHTVPLINVVFRRLKGDKLTATFVKRRIALSRLCFYQPGYILVDNVLSERLATDAKWFDVNFSYAGKNWSQVQIPKLGLSTAESAFLLPKYCDDEWALVFNFGKDKKLILNCVEFLVRGYSRRSEIPRILATYEWSEVKSRLFAQDTPDEEIIPKRKTLTGTEKWIVYPHRDMAEDDDVLLAHIANDTTYAAKAARSVYSQLDPVRLRNGEELPITVLPWFNSETKLKCRGFWSADKTSFYCTELIGLKEPTGIPIEPRRDHSTRTPTPEDRIEQERLIALRDDPMTIVLTDLNQPRSQYPREEVEDSSFEVIKTRVVNRIKVPKLTGQQKTIHKDGAEIEDFSTGDAAGQRNDTTGKAVLVDREFGVNSSGMLYEMWKSFQRLKAAQQIDHLWWFAPPSQKNSNSDFQCVAFEDDLKNPKATKWLSLKKGGQRGLLLILVKVQDKFILVVEIQRDEWIDKHGIYKEDNFSGLVCEVADSGEATHIVKELNGYLPGKKGVFLQFKSSLPNKIEVFEHRSTGNPNGWCDATAVLALSKMEVKVRRPQILDTEKLKTDRSR